MLLDVLSWQTLYADGGTSNTKNCGKCFVTPTDGGSRRENRVHHKADEVGHERILPGVIASIKGFHLESKSRY